MGILIPIILAQLQDMLVQIFQAVIRIQVVQQVVGQLRVIQEAMVQLKMQIKLNRKQVTQGLGMRLIKNQGLNGNTNDCFSRFLFCKKGEKR